ncbi:MAG: respiratory nitrate reductase subunit gamma [Desulfobacteraceae bacterium]|nr:MAG: respiratory nitrate reductase subunit gamma [Desulfobacteraceae bacterium]
MKKMFFIALFLTLFTFGGKGAEASWLIDTSKFHISAHGQNSCQDCHENIVENRLHPNPEDVSKKLADIFHIDQCLSCHDNIIEDLNQGFHGAEKVKYSDRYLNCLNCHDPHYQLRLDKDHMAQFDLAKPIHEQCGACHDEQSTLPAFSTEDESCLACHRYFEVAEPEGQKKISKICFNCHGQKSALAQEMTGWRVSPINAETYQSAPHAHIACTACHPQALAFNHGDQQVGDCRQCHVPHDEKVAHDVHMAVSCEACHLREVRPVRDPKSKLIIWTRGYSPGQTSRIHDMVLGPDEASCKRCHFKGNGVGAVSMILPAKSILCMPCHAATFSVGDTTTILSLIVFLAGIVMVLSYVLSGSMPGKTDAGPVSNLFKLLWNVVKTVFSQKIFSIIKTVILDVLLQKRLYHQSRKRWFIHGLIFYAFVFRFSWGAVGLIGSLWKPEWSSIWAMLDKNHPTTAFLFDLTGIMIVIGVILAFIRERLARLDRPNGLPKKDRVALGLIAAIVVIGFILEGMRIAMTGIPASTTYAFIGHWISTLFSDPSTVTSIYGYVWYLHAILAGAFVAYIPFSRLFHIILAPLVLAGNVVSVHKGSKK